MFELGVRENIQPCETLLQIIMKNPFVRQDHLALYKVLTKQNKKIKKKNIGIYVWYKAEVINIYLLIFLFILQKISWVDMADKEVVLCKQYQEAKAFLPWKTASILWLLPGFEHQTPTCWKYATIWATRQALDIRIVCYFTRIFSWNPNYSILHFVK